MARRDAALWLAAVLAAATVAVSAPTPLHVLERLAAGVAEELTSLVQKATGRDELRHLYERQVFYLEPVHGDDALDEAMEKLGPVFQQRVKAVQAIASRAQRLAAEHEHDADLTAEDVSFINGLDRRWDDAAGVDLGAGNTTLVSPPHFPAGVRLDGRASAVRFPTGVFEGWMWHKFKPLWWQDEETLNALQWTGKLDATFVDNVRLDPTLHWQYFATRNGLLRYFPGHRWRLPADRPDTFDARQRPWFTQTLSSAKDLVVLIDVSGSIHGPTFEILKISVKRLLGTLGEFDFFNVLQFNATASYLVPCFSRRLVPTTTHHKRLVYEALDAIVPLGRANWSNALDFTYRQLVHFQAARGSSSGCHQAVVLISDGGTEFPKEQLERMRNDSRTADVRVFTLAVGPHPIPTTNMRNISCHGRGQHAAVMNYGAIANKVRNYLQVLNRPLALSRDEDLIDWSLSYADAAGLGPVLTASKPVYDLGGGGANGSGQAIVGVAAVDVPLLLFDAALPDSQLGFGGYKMAVTPTASAVLHPKLHHQQAYLDDPLMVPFEQLEPAGPWTEPLRRHLVDRQSGSQSYVGVEHVDGNYVVEQKRTWFYQPITKSAYSLAVSVVDGTNIIVPNLELQRRAVWDANSVTRVAPWNFCAHLNHNVSTSHRLLLAELAQRFEKGGQHCDQTALGHLLWDLHVTANASRLWYIDPRFDSRFVSTTGGVTRMQRHTRQRVQLDLADPRNSSTILRLIHSSAQLLITPPSHGVDEFQVAGKVTSKDQVMAVTGACVSRETVASLWKRATGAILERTPLLDESGTNVFWLDEGGHVLQTEDVHVQPGTFLGAAGVQPQLFRSLLLAQPTPLYRKVVVTETTECVMDAKTPASAAAALTNAFRALGAAAGLLYGVLVSLLAVASASASSSGPPVELELDQLRPPEILKHLCTKERVLYRLSSDVTASNFSVACSSMCASPVSQTVGDAAAEVRDIFVAPVPTTRTVLVLASAACRCASPFHRHGLVDVRLRQKRCDPPAAAAAAYRAAPAACHAHHVQEETMKCSGGPPQADRPPLTAAMFLTASIAWILR